KPFVLLRKDRGEADGVRSSSGRFVAVLDCAVAVGAWQRASCGVLQIGVRSDGGVSPGWRRQRRGGETLRGWRGVLGERRVSRASELQSRDDWRVFGATDSYCGGPRCCVRASDQGRRDGDLACERGTWLASGARRGSFRASLGDWKTGVE